MLSLSITRDKLLRPANLVAGIVERKSTVPILGNILIKVENGVLSLSGSDSEIQLTTKLAVENATDGSTTVSAQKFIEILRSLPDQNQIAITQQSDASGQMLLRSGKSQFRLHTLPAEDFPTIAVGNDFLADFSIEQKRFRSLLDRVSFSMAQQDIRYYLNGMLLTTEDQTLSSVATDGHRLALASLVLEQAIGKIDVIIPRKTVLNLNKMLDNKDDNLNIKISNNQIILITEQTEIVSKLIEGKFPDHKRVIPTHYTKQIELDRHSFLDALQRASILCNEKLRGVHLQIAKETLKITGHNADQEESEEELSIQADFDPFDVGFNVNYLLDALSNLSDAEKVTMSVQDSNSSALITLPGQDNFKYVVMPMRI
jgi:DNA polymerase-3 subunit beta